MKRSGTKVVIAHFPSTISDFLAMGLEAFAKKHGIQSLDDLKERLTGVIILARSAEQFSAVRVPKRDALRKIQAIKGAADKIDRLLKEDMYLAYSLMFTAEDVLDEGRRLRETLKSVLVDIQSQTDGALSRMAEGKFNSPYVHNKRGRPRTEKYEWLLELYGVFLNYSSKKTIANANPKAKSVNAKDYSGAFFLFAKDFCVIAEVTIGDDDLFQSIKRIIKKNK